MKNTYKLGVGNIKFILAAFIFLALIPASIAGEMESLRNISGDFSLLNSPVWEELSDVQNKELFSDYHIRYIIKGRINFRAKPPVFTAENGKVFKVTRYPFLLRFARNKVICIEGYTKQRDDTSELIIEKVLSPDTLENTASLEYIRSMQRDSKILSQENNTYTLSNIAWNMKHDAEGNIAKDEHGNPIAIWRSGIKVDISKVKNVYFGKKTTIKPIRYGNHGVLMITFEPGGVTAPDGSQIGSLAFSVDAYYTDPTQMIYSPLEALKGKYQVYYSIYGMDCYSELKFNYNEFNMPERMIVVPYPLLINKEQKMLLLDNAITKATENKEGEMYSILYNSCANSILSIINSALPENRKIKAGWLPEIFYRVQTTLPGAMAALMVREGVTGEALPEITPGNYKEYLNRLAPGATTRK